MTTSRSVTVVGAGVVGLACAIELARDGWRVVVLGDAPPFASEAAAGMLAPASEAVLDDASAGFVAALRRARERWEPWAARLAIPLDRAGAVHVADPEVLVRRRGAAEALGFRTGRAGEGGLLLPDDAVLDPAFGMNALRRALAEAGGLIRAGRVETVAGVLQVDGEPLRTDAVVVAAGWGSAALAGAAPELAALRPIKGQLLRVAGRESSGPVIRAPGAYLAPGAGGWTVGATMEPGRDDLHPDAEALSRLREAAAAVRPELAGAVATSAVGVRAETPDGLPLVGRSCAGPWLATGMRRNGWLLAPLVAEGVAAYLAGRDPDAALAGQAHAWRPGRVLTREQGPA